MFPRAPEKKILGSNQNIALPGFSFRGWTLCGWFDGCNFEEADFTEADLRCSRFWGANLARTKFVGAKCTSANFAGANLSGADFTGTLTEGATFDTAVVEGAIPPKSLVELPPIGEAFTCYKKVRDWDGRYRILELVVPTAAGRVSTCVGRGCRVERVLVKKVHNLPGVDYRGSYAKFYSLFGLQFGPFTYELGKVAVADCFDPSPWVEYAHGLHVFETMEEAVEYR
jgi:hypothetical protein